MVLVLRCFVLSFIFLWLYVTDISKFGIQVMTFNVQRPVIEFVNSSYLRLINLTSRRYNRHDPMYYLNLIGESYVTIDKHYIASASIDEFISYTSKRKFVSSDLNFCRLLTVLTCTPGTRDCKVLYKKSMKEKFRKFQPQEDCVLSPGIYCFYNLTWPAARIPFKLPFNDGRAELKIRDKNGNLVCSGYVDLDFRSNYKIYKNKS